MYCIDKSIILYFQKQWLFTTVSLSSYELSLSRLIFEKFHCSPIFSEKQQQAVQAHGSKIALVRLYLRVPQAAGQVKILIFLVKIKFFPIYANIFCDAGQVPIFRNFEA